MFVENFDIIRVSENETKLNSSIWSGKDAEKFIFQQSEIEITDEYKYLGIYLGRSCSFVAAKKHIIAQQANRALFSLLKKIRSLSLHYDIQIDMFNEMVKPILLYGCEIWGMGNFDVLERIQLKFYKYIFNLKNLRLHT